MIENDEQVKETIIENLEMYQKSEDAKKWADDLFNEYSEEKND